MHTTERKSRSPDAQLRQHADEIKAGQLAEALSALDAEQSLTSDQHDAVVELSDAIVEGILSPAETALEQSADERVERTVATLFDLDDAKLADGSGDRS